MPGNPIGLVLDSLLKRVFSSVSRGLGHQSDFFSSSLFRGLPPDTGDWFLALPPLVQFHADLPLFEGLVLPATPVVEAQEFMDGLTEEQGRGGGRLDPLDVAVEELPPTALPAFQARGAEVLQDVPCPVRAGLGVPAWPWPQEWRRSSSSSATSVPALDVLPAGLQQLGDEPGCLQFVEHPHANAEAIEGDLLDDVPVETALPDELQDKFLLLVGARPAIGVAAPTAMTIAVGAVFSGKAIGSVAFAVAVGRPLSVPVVEFAVVPVGDEADLADLTVDAVLEETI